MKSFLARNKVFLLHLSFWVMYLSYRIYDMSKYLGIQRTFIYISIPTTCNILACYVHYFFILPPLIRDKKVLPYLAKLILLLGVVFAVRIPLENLVMGPMFPKETYFKTIEINRIISTVWDVMTFLIFTGMIRFTFDWFNLENKKKQLENEKLVAELNYLKAQINPHFLFNTLHNLNYLVYSKSDQATNVIIRLSNIMRYMIYDANKDKVAIQKEIAYMNDYIHLESIRLNQAFNLTFDINGKGEQVEIAPLVMLTFLENAFKHGVSDQEKNCWIKVKLDISHEKITYLVSNRILKSKRNEKSGFGLENVQKRLQLSYPGKHNLSISTTDDVYSIDLTLHLV